MELKRARSYERWRAVCPIWAAICELRSYGNQKIIYSILDEPIESILVE